MIKFLLCALTFLCALAHASDPESRVETISQGPVKGYKEDGVFVFYGIPYARAPTGVNKFQPPTDPPVWTETFEATNKNIFCPQGSSPVPGVELNIKEDCLIANVFVPDTTERNLPVLVIIHGGAYQIGNGLIAVPKTLVRTKNIVAVTFNYRLGVHGFLCLGTKDVPGNAGMKDQVALLRWVKKNIASFGGNPEDITLSGYSAGSSAVDLHQLSKSSRGLFNKVIPESGANVGVWSVQLDPIRTAQDFAKQLKFENVNDLDALEEFYKNLSLELLTSKLFLNEKDSTVVFAPCVEKKTGSYVFLDDSPVNILEKGDYEKLPMLYGFNNMEGIFRLEFNDLSLDEWVKGMNDNFSDFLPADLEFKSEEEKKEVAQKIKEFYFGDKPVSTENMQPYVDYFTDVMFAFSTLRSVKLQLEAGNNKIYLYEYSYVGEEGGRNSDIMEKYNIRGADHSDQTFAILDLFSSDESNLSEKTKRMRAVMRELWYNFISTGTPVPPGSSYPEWPAVSKDWGPHMSLNETLELRESLLEDRTRFWDAIYEKHYRHPKSISTSSAVPTTHSFLIVIFSTSILSIFIQIKKKKSSINNKGNEKVSIKFFLRIFRQ